MNTDDVAPDRSVPSPASDEDRYITRVELAWIMGVSVATIDRMVAQGMPSVTWGGARAGSCCERHWHGPVHRIDERAERELVGRRSGQAGFAYAVGTAEGLRSGLGQYKLVYVAPRLHNGAIRRYNLVCIRPRHPPLWGDVRGFLWAVLDFEAVRDDFDYKEPVPRSMQEAFVTSCVPLRKYFPRATVAYLDAGALQRSGRGSAQ